MSLSPRDARNQAHPNKTNTLMLGIIMLLIGILSIQIWLLYSALNNALDANQDLAVAAFVGSLILFLIGLWLLKFLPDTRGRFVEKKQPENKYR